MGPSCDILCRDIVNRVRTNTTIFTEANVGELYAKTVTWAAFDNIVSAITSDNHDQEIESSLVDDNHDDDVLRMGDGI